MAPEQPHLTDLLTSCVDQKTPTQSILIVDDTPANLELLGRLLTQARYRVRKLPSGELAISSALASPPDLILLDIRMPGIDGFEVCRRLKNHELTRDIPIIFISALDASEDKVCAFDIGGVDYITKPFHPDEVLARVATHLRLSQLQQRLATQNRELERLATTDPLTGLLNRRSFIMHSQHCQATASRYSRPFALLLFDIDLFKQVNDTYGHDVGDAVLIHVTKCISRQIRDVDLFARWGGEEFIVLMSETTLEQALQLAERLRNALVQTPIEPVGTVTASFGVADWRDNESLEMLIRHADSALFTAKRAGRNCVKAHHYS
jgi:diguanylate cyclase (GGDEF)-like protein